MSPRSLFEGTPEFLWRDETKFKNLDAKSGREEAALASFGVAVGRCAIEATPGNATARRRSALELREDIMQAGLLVDTRSLLTACWSISVPVVYLTVFPLQQKRMHAMTARVGDRYAILLGRASRYVAPIAYTLAHELGHVLLGHLEHDNALVEMADPVSAERTDDEEATADRFALELLTGSSNPDVQASLGTFNSAEVAQAAVATGPGIGIDPGVLALCLGHGTGRWGPVYGALRMISPGATDTAGPINELASSQFDWEALSYANRAYLARMIGRRYAA